MRHCLLTRGKTPFSNNEWVLYDLQGAPWYPFFFTKCCHQSDASIVQLQSHLLTSNTVGAADLTGTGLAQMYTHTLRKDGNEVSQVVISCSPA